ncbi:MAG: class I SAM-dependent methyltransferase [Actinomycetota bacterium]|nr:class I SAM-dependent methyltransferase [Actinomycetota bacterium]
MPRPRGRAVEEPGPEADAHERINVSPDSPWWAEHRSRYHFAVDFCRGKPVLDVACGTGYGAAVLLDAGAAGVMGVDMSLEALAQACAMGRERWGVCQADATVLPLADGAVPVVTSFETIEHLQEPERFVGELRRVLAPDGVLLLSTPNALYTKPVNGKPANPFHVKEFTPAELSSLLAQHFGAVELLGQTPDPRYEVCPYWQLPEHLPTDPLGRLRVISWKVQSRLPAPVRERVSQIVHGRSFFPGEHGFAFTESATETGHVLLAVCRP